MLILSGCEDSASKQRDQVQQSLSEAGKKLQVALAAAGGPVSDQSAQAEQNLNSIIASLNQISGGEPGQEAAKSLLAATALRELADMHLTSAELIESDHRGKRAVIRDKVSAAQRLAATAAGLAQADAAADRDSLVRQLQSAKSEVTKLSEQYSQLEGPIAKHNSQNQVSTTEVEKLRSEVGNLLRRAQELGHADGFDTYRQAKHIDRQADKLEYDIAQREIELDYSLKPEHDMIGTQVSELQGLIQAIEAAQKQLQDFQTVASRDAEATQAEMQRLMGEVTKSLDVIVAESNGKLKEAYEQAGSALEKAGSQADAAVRNLKGDDAHAARMIAVRIREAQGRLHWNEAGGLADQKQTLEALAQASKDIGASGDYAKQLAETTAAHKDALQKATEAYAAANEQLANVQSRGDSMALDAYRTNLERATNLLSGKAEPAEPEAIEPAAGRSSARGNRSAGDEGEQAP